MERLTKRELNKVGNVHYCKCFFRDCDGNCSTCDLQYEADMKLKEYEDAEEQGLLIRLPCKVGDDVWTIMCGMTGKHPALFRQEFTLSMFSHFGTAVFLTKEEAEAALERMNEKENENE